MKSCLLLLAVLVVSTMVMGADSADRALSETEKQTAYERGRKAFEEGMWEQAVMHLREAGDYNPRSKKYAFKLLAEAERNLAAEKAVTDLIRSEGREMGECPQNDADAIGAYEKAKTAIKGKNYNFAFSLLEGLLVAYGPDYKPSIWNKPALELYNTARKEAGKPELVIKSLSTEHPHVAPVEEPSKLKPVVPAPVQERPEVKVEQEKPKGGEKEADAKPILHVPEETAAELNQKIRELEAMVSELQKQLAAMKKKAVPPEELKKLRERATQMDEVVNILGAKDPKDAIIKVKGMATLRIVPGPPLPP